MRRLGVMAWACVVGLCCAGLSAALHGRAADAPPAAVPPPNPAPQAVTDQQVKTATLRGVDYLLKQKAPDGTWEAGAAWGKPASEKGGQTALVLNALLAANESLGDPPLDPPGADLAKSLAWLRDLTPEATYVAALQAQVIGRMPKPTMDAAADKARTDALERTRKYLQDAMLPAGGYTYAAAEKADPNAWDTSNSHYGIMGIDALADARVEIPTSYWRTTDKFWRDQQNPDGGWGYSKSQSDSRPATTAGGLDALLITSLCLDRELRLTPKPDKALDSALAALRKDFDPASGDYYYLYNVERAAMRLGLASIGNHDWYGEIAVHLVATQKGDGSWAGGNLTFWGKSTPIATTAYALMILADGRTPVILNKLEYNGPWNARPRDVAEVTRWTARALAHPLAWQTVGFDTPLEIWERAPILVITGSQDPKFAPADIQRLRDYINAGGTIFSTADGASPAFTAAMQAVGLQVAPPAAVWAALPDDHPLYTKWTKVSSPPKLLGLSDGARLVWLHSPADFGGSWQRRAYASAEHFRIMSNLLFEAVGKKLPASRLDQAIPIPPPPVPPVPPPPANN